MFIATNKIPVPYEHQEHMKQSFQNNAPDLKEVPGFLQFELWTTEDAVVSVSKWESNDAFDSYVNSELFQKHHGSHGSGDNAHAARPEITYYQCDAIV